MSSRKKELPKAQWSTAISDAVLGFLTLYAVSSLMATAAGHSRLGSRGVVIAQWQLLAAFSLGLTGVAASVGSFRFAGVTAVRPLHDFLAAMSMFLTMPILGVISIFAFTGNSVQSPLPLAFLVTLVAGWSLFQFVEHRRLKKAQADYILITSLFGVLCLLFRCGFILIGKSGSESSASVSAAWQGVLGAGLVMAAGAVGIKGALQIGPLKLMRVDAFHYLMAIANICVVTTFQNLWA